MDRSKIFEGIGKCHMRIEKTLITKGSKIDDIEHSMRVEFAGEITRELAWSPDRLVVESEIGDNSTKFESNLYILTKTELDRLINNVRNATISEFGIIKEETPNEQA